MYRYKIEATAWGYVPKVRKPFSPFWKRLSTPCSTSDVAKGHIDAHMAEHPQKGPKWLRTAAVMAVVMVVGLCVLTLAVVAFPKVAAAGSKVIKIVSKHSIYDGHFTKLFVVYRWVEPDGRECKATTLGGLWCAELKLIPDKEPSP